MAGTWQDKDGDGKVSWYPDPTNPNEKPGGGVDKASIESSEKDKPAAGATAGIATTADLSSLTFPRTSLSDPKELKAEIDNEFKDMFSAGVPAKVLSAYVREVRSLMAGRDTGQQLTPTGGITSTQGVSAQERKDILNKYVQAYAKDLLNAADLGDAKAKLALQRGKFGLSLTNLKNAYANNGIPMTGQSLSKLAIESAGNEQRLQANLNLVNLQAKTYFPALADKIDQGYTVKQLLSPYLQTRAAILEEDPDTVDISKLTEVAKDPKQMMGLYDYEISLRKDPKWRFTKNAQDSISKVASDIARTFGLLG